jgi:hypothetical protein
VQLAFNGEIFFWKGPSPFHFVTVPEDESEELRAVSGIVSYGWGVIPVAASIGTTTWKTSLFPKDGGYVVPIRASVRTAQKLNLGDDVRIVLDVGDSG